MPKRTRAEKQRAILHRQLKYKLPSLTPPSPAFSSVKNTPAEENLTVVSYFAEDLKKSLFFILAIIALEICLYFASIKQSLKF
ncbi:hypothetical protein HY214_02045 [Candidatus Roizmanbacteria bacterium]|nr:hypothetical protein [Candidatus Roizmanbacteria bacterium]